jgi:hypothetical protein
VEIAECKGYRKERKRLEVRVKSGYNSAGLVFRQGTEL